MGTGNYLDGQTRQPDVGGLHEIGIAPDGNRAFSKRLARFSFLIVRLGRSQPWQGWRRRLGSAPGPPPLSP